MAAIARDVLKDAARSGGSLLTWGELRLRMAGGLPHLHPDDQGELLVAVDQETPVGEPLLSTFVASSDASLHWLYRHVRFSLGGERIPEPDLPAHWATEVLRLRQHFNAPRANACLPACPVMLTPLQQTISRLLAHPADPTRCRSPCVSQYILLRSPAPIVRASP
ncbi:hypothetical protein OG885_10200 [Streptomyces sp. NBC_00028]|uniref:hypothetical protein n=1 Tax=Streptomyces sp. NBC_00028 TaxID=2975624 RepID=UPI003255536D